MTKISIALALCIMTLLGGACLKDNDCQPKTPESEESTILAFATANGITATKHSSGMYYQITNPGTGTVPTVTSDVSVKYTGKYMDGTIFDQKTSPITFNLSRVIAAWSIGVPLIKEGGSIKLIVPSSLAYGCTGSAPIPPYAVLYFEIELIDVI